MLTLLFIICMFGVFGKLFFFGLKAAWGFARWHFPGKKMLLSLYIVLMLFPFQILMLSEYLVLNRMGMIDTLWALILPGVCSTFPVFIMYRFFSKLTPATRKFIEYLTINERLERL